MSATPSPTVLAHGWARAVLQLERGPRAAIDELRPHVAAGLAGIERHRIGDLVLSRADELDLPEPMRARLGQVRAHARRLLMVRAIEIQRLADLFGEADLRWMMIKGPALAMQTTGDPAGRGTGDIDVLVDPSTVARAHALLEPAGWISSLGGSVVPGSWAWSHLLRSYHEIGYVGPSSTVDLHWRLDPTRGSLPDFERLWAERVEIDLGTAKVQSLSPTRALEHACYHAATDEWAYLRSLVDVHRLAAAHADWDRIPRSPMVLSTLAVVERCLGLPDAVPADIRSWIDARADRVVERALRAQERAIRQQQWDGWGSHAVRDARYRLSAGRGVVDWRTAALTLALPLHALEGVHDPRASTAVPKGLLRRGAGLARRARGRA